jgi:hypothetical protein
MGVSAVRWDLERSPVRKAVVLRRIDDPLRLATARFGSKLSSFG